MSSPHVQHKRLEGTNKSDAREIPQVLTCKAKRNARTRVSGNIEGDFGVTSLSSFKAIIVSGKRWRGRRGQGRLLGEGGVPLLGIILSCCLQRIYIQLLTDTGTCSCKNEPF